MRNYILRRPTLWATIYPAPLSVRLRFLVPYAKELPKFARRKAGLTDARSTPQGKAIVITHLSSACNERDVQTLALILLHHLNMATHTGLTSAVLNYKPPEALIPEFEPPPDRANFADPKKTSLLSRASKVDDLTPWIGTELYGLQINQLTNAQRDELALLVAEVGFMALYRPAN